jgi:hypothetical protein
MWGADVIFRPELAEEIILGRKTATRRIPSDNPRSPWWIGGCRYGFDKDFTINPGRGKHRVAEAHVTRCALEELKAMKEKDAHREGFDRIIDFDRYWASLHGSPGELSGVVYQGTWVWVVEFKVDRVMPGAAKDLAAIRGLK